MVISDSFLVLSLVVLFLFYLVQYFLIFFANTALAGAALIRLRGGNPSVKDGFRIAWEHVGAILGYALIAATVGMFLRTLSRRRQSTIGRLVTATLSMGWNLATFLVVPILAVENVGPFQAIKRSAHLLKKTWGEQIIGNFGLGAIFGLINFILILLGLPVFIMLFKYGAPLILIGFILLGFVLLFFLVGLFNMTFTGIYTAALFQYAEDGSTGGFFDATMVKTAFLAR